MSIVFITLIATTGNMDNVKQFFQSALTRLLRKRTLLIGSLNILQPCLRSARELTRDYPHSSHARLLLESLMTMDQRLADELVESCDAQRMLEWYLGSTE